MPIRVCAFTTAAVSKLRRQLESPTRLSFANVPPSLPMHPPLPPLPQVFKLYGGAQGFLLATNVSEPDPNHAATLLRCAQQLMAQAEHVSLNKRRRSCKAGSAQAMRSMLAHARCMQGAWQL